MDNIHTKYDQNLRVCFKLFASEMGGYYQQGREGWGGAGGGRGMGEAGGALSETYISPAVHLGICHSTDSMQQPWS